MFFGIKRGQIIKIDAVLDLSRLCKIDFVDLEKCEIAFAFFR